MSLEERLARRALRMTKVSGADTPAVYTSLESEWRAMTSGAALLDLSWRRSLCVRGTDAREYLHGQTTADVKALASGGGVPALALTAQGRVTALLDLYFHGPFAMRAGLWRRLAPAVPLPGFRAGDPDQDGLGVTMAGAEAAADPSASYEDEADDHGDLFEIRVNAADLERVAERLGRFVVADDVDFAIDAPVCEAGSDSAAAGMPARAGAPGQTASDPASETTEVSESRERGTGPDGPGAVAADSEAGSAPAPATAGTPEREGDVAKATSAGVGAAVRGAGVQGAGVRGAGVQGPGPAPERTTIGVAGPKAAEVLGRAGFSEVAAESCVADLARSWFVRDGSIGGIDVTVFGRGDLWVPIFELVVERESAEALWSVLEDAGCVAAGHDAYEVVRVESAAPRWGQDVDDATIAIEAGLEWAIHFDKGCYVGQEVIERAVSRGRVNYRLSLLEARAEVEPGSVVVAAGGQALSDAARQRSAVRSVVCSPGRGPICLAYLPVDVAHPGTPCRIAGPAGDIDATVAPWPRQQ
ncbi:MAG: hypothetical protein D6760_07510 [Deltaproteobacteria bacterium]|nr:MAG: hypothetical protein D6760_07510 [Deltaproteobacteria bacterium]